jgi:outer membrane murein-binding lipoprotein Lpp
MLKSLLILSATFLLAGCVISGDGGYDLRSESKILKAKIDSLITEINDLKYGAENTLKEANQKIKEKKFIDSKVLLTTVIRRYPISKEYTTAQQLLKSITPKAEEESFYIASKNTDLLNAYLLEYPRGRYTARANRLIK